MTTLCAGSLIAARALQIGGIFSANATTNPDFHAATHVYAMYCSSDAWTGVAGSVRARAGPATRPSPSDLHPPRSC